MVASVASMKEKHEEEIERLIVVEYLQPVMSKELLCKFPDNSAFDFNYDQSSIWSPLVPRAYPPMDRDWDFDFMPPRKLNFDMGLDFKKVGCGIKKKISTTGFNLNRSAFKNKMMMMKKNPKNKIELASACDFSPSPVKVTCNPNPIASKVWTKAIRAASKTFKKKKRDPIDHVRLSNYLRAENF